MSPAEGRRSLELRKEYLSEGYVVQRNLFAESEMMAFAEELASAEPRRSGPNELSSGSMIFASNLFYRSEAVRRLVCDPRLVALVTALGGPDIWARWDQAVWKGIGAGPFPWHQDNGYTGLGQAHIQAWIAVTGMTPDNGGLLIAPGSHATPLAHRWVGSFAECPDEPDSFQELEASPGDVVVFSSLLLHATTPNCRGPQRLAYVVEYLPLTVADHSVDPPHLVVARRGAIAASFEDLSGCWEGSAQ